ncbi:alpha/beta hydrolase [Oceanicaulis sp. LC35]|uniref:alpha/beta hydrolase n=1 Tax=Oceanicaulis sp. LC35 TaxID=3349635 RepID=UPI003F828440
MTDPIRTQYELEDGVMAAWRWPNPGAPLMVFAHANGFNGGAYRKLLTPLADRFEIIAPDLRGHGRSTLPADPRTHKSWNIYADDLLALYARLDRAPALLAGHSMGASSTMLAASRMDAPPPLALVEPVILPPSIYRMAHTPLWRFMKGTVKQGATARKRSNGWPDAASVAERYRTRPTFARWANGVLEDYLEDGLTAAAQGVCLSCDPEWEAANFEGQAHNLLKAARKLGARMHVLKASIASTVINASGLKARGAEFDAIEGGHLAPMDQPEKVADWLGRMADQAGL